MYHKVPSKLLPTSKIFVSITDCTTTYVYLEVVLNMTRINVFYGMASPYTTQANEWESIAGLLEA